MPSGRVLIVDDEALVRWSLREGLTAVGYDILEAGLASEALERILATDLDLVLLDFKLPDAAADTILARITSLSPDTQIILMTESSTVERAVAAMKLGAYDYVNKPFNLDEVLLRIERALEMRDLRRELRALRNSQRTPDSRRPGRGTGSNTPD